MALRVLLADDSTDLKKAIQLSLQDFAIELRSVNMGTDVLSVCKSYKPDMVFADVLLQKKNGYEVCKEIKLDPETSSTPVVLLWSGFMEIDAQKMQDCGADASLEKPFEAGQIRDLTKKLVPKVADGNPFASFIQLPDLPQKDEWGVNAEPSTNQESNEPSWDMNSFVGISPTQDAEPVESTESEEFSSVNIAPQAPESSNSPEVPNNFLDDVESDGDGEWENQKIGKFQLNISEDAQSFEGLEGLEIPKITEDLTDTSFLWNEESDTKLSSNPEGAQANPKVAIDTINQIDVKSDITPEVNLDLNTPEKLNEIPELDISSPETDPYTNNKEISVISTAEFAHGEPSEVQENHIQPATSNPSDDLQLSSQRAEEIFREEVRSQIQSMLQDIVPEIAKKAIQEKIDRLLDNSDG